MLTNNKDMFERHHR